MPGVADESFSSCSNQNAMPIAPYIARALARCSWVCSL
jgi:hypothetical protein